jgi:hypothetical protein
MCGTANALIVPDPAAFRKKVSSTVYLHVWLTILVCRNHVTYTINNDDDDHHHHPLIHSYVCTTLQVTQELYIKRLLKAPARVLIVISLRSAHKNLNKFAMIKNRCR